jgi:hypothetical protein
VTARPRSARSGDGRAPHVDNDERAFPTLADTVAPAWYSPRPMRPNGWPARRTSSSRGCTVRDLVVAVLPAIVPPFALSPIRTNQFVGWA